MSRKTQILWTGTAFRTGILDPARNEPRDLYDLWYLTANKYGNLADVTEAVDLKMRFRQRELSDVKGGLVRKEARLNKLWNARLAAQMAVLPEYDEVYRAVTRETAAGGISWLAYHASYHHGQILPN